jgi:hypothetical protein
MAVSLISSVQVTESGNVTIPANCSAVYALVIGSDDAPEIAGISMTKIVGRDKTDKVAGVGVYQYIGDAVGTVMFDNADADYIALLYVSGSDGYDKDVVTGTKSESVTGNLKTSTNSLAICVMAGMIGATAITGDATAFSYVVNETTVKAGWLVPGDSSLACVASDSGISTGYWIIGKTIHHDAVLLKEGYWSFEPVKHTVTWWYMQDLPNGYKLYGKYDNGVATGDTKASQSQPASSVYYEYVHTWHEPVYQPAWDEKLPDVWVAGQGAEAARSDNDPSMGGIQL